MDFCLCKPQNAISLIHLKRVKSTYLKTTTNGRNVMFSFLFSKTEPLLDEASRQWLEDCFIWATEHFDGAYMQNQSQLILPDNNFYQGRVASIHEMADNMFNNTLNYAGLQNWPIKFVEPQYYKPNNVAQLSFENGLRGDNTQIACADYSGKGSAEILVSYHPGQVNQPQDFIATTAQNLATILIQQVKVLPPGGQEYVKQAIDFLACFMGFGVIMANTAYQFKGGCGSCNNANLNRLPGLSEHETLYALALFCQHKGIALKPALKHIKQHLKKAAKQAIEDCKSTNLMQNKQSPALSAS